MSGIQTIGKRALDDLRNSPVYHFVRLVVELKASYFVFENVRGLMIGEHRRFLEEIIQEFRITAIGSSRIIMSSTPPSLGSPRTAGACSFLALAGDILYLRIPKPPIRRAVTQLSSLSKRPPSGEALKDLPEADDYDELLERDWVLAKFNKSTNYSAPLRGESADRDDHSTPREFNPRSLLPA